MLLAACVTTVPPQHRITRAEQPGARLAVSWIGHASMLIQIDDRFVLTDPLLVDTIGGGVSHRKVGVPIDARVLPPLDAVLVSHTHFDHLSLDSIGKVEKTTRRLYMPEGGLVYLSDFGVDAVDMKPWETAEDRGMQITAVPVDHVGARYLLDTWMHSFTGWVIRYHGVTVYFSGDTAYARDDFRETARRIGHIDLALLAIAPIHPRQFMKRVHMDPTEALGAFADLGADRMIPIHFDTIGDSTDAPHEARDTLVRLVAERGLTSRVDVLAVGEQRIILPR
jgi:L-ascorbate metabolism protein UlaG (beta-lactamase superfamily)